MKQNLIILSNGQIDINNRDRLFELSINKLKGSQITERNKQLILDFLRDCELGKTTQNKAKKKIGKLRLAKYAGMLRNLAVWLNKDLDKVIQQDMEDFILKYERSEIRQENGKPYNDSTKLTFKKGIIKFYKWLNKGQRPEMVSWIDLSPVHKETPALTYDEVQKLINHSTTIKTKAFIMFLFDSGVRLEEAENVRLNNLTKEADYYKVRIAYSKTKPRTISVPLSTEMLDLWLSRHPQRHNSEAQLFPYSGRSAWLTLRRIAEKAGIAKKVGPHVLRHSSATYYCNKLSYYQFCYRYGWAFDSDMPKRYIDESGINDIAAKVVKDDSVSGLKEENFKLQQDLRLLKDRVETLDEVMTILLQNSPEALQGLRKTAENMGLMNKLRLFQNQQKPV